MQSLGAHQDLTRLGRQVTIAQQKGDFDVFSGSLESLELLVDESAKAVEDGAQRAVTDLLRRTQHFGVCRSEKAMEIAGQRVGVAQLGHQLNGGAGALIELTGDRLRMLPEPGRADAMGCRSLQVGLAVVPQVKHLLGLDLFQPQHFFSRYRWFWRRQSRTSNRCAQQR